MNPAALLTARSNQRSREGGRDRRHQTAVSDSVAGNVVSPLLQASADIVGMSTAPFVCKMTRSPLGLPSAPSGKTKDAPYQPVADTARARAAT